jgi:TolB-like protein/tetratricopeptide (TPR) repeat protein
VQERGLSRALVIEINSLLMKSKSVDVIGYESTNSRLLSGLSLEAIAERLDVDYVLAGTIGVSTDSMALNIKLHDRTGTQLWSEQISETINNLFSVQESIARKLTNQLGSKVNSHPIEKIISERCQMPTNPIALEKYYTARHFVSLRTFTEKSRTQFYQAIKNYEELIGEYPDFAEAKSGLAWALLYQNTYNLKTNRKENLKRAKELAKKSIKQCPTLGEAMRLTSNQFQHKNRWIRNYQILNAALEMDPGQTYTLQKLSEHYSYSGLVKKALETAEFDYRQNPLTVRSIKLLQRIYMGLGRLEEAFTLFNISKELGSMEPEYVKMSIDMKECNSDLKCLSKLFTKMANQPELMEQFVDLWTKPDTSEEKQNKNADLISLLKKYPELVNFYLWQTCKFEHLTPAFFQFKDVADKAKAHWYWPTVWHTDCKNIWSSPEFPTFVESNGLVEYWREVGWPEMCWPEGESFTCGIKESN